MPATGARGPWDLWARCQGQYEQVAVPVLHMGCSERGKSQQVSSGPGLRSHVSHGGTPFPLRTIVRGRRHRGRSQEWLTSDGGGEDGGSKQPCAMQGELALGLVAGPVSCLCPGPDLRPGLLLCTGGQVMTSLFFRGRRTGQELQMVGRVKLRLLQTSPRDRPAWAAQCWVGKRNQGLESQAVTSEWETWGQCTLSDLSRPFLEDAPMGQALHSCCACSWGQSQTWSRGHGTRKVTAPVITADTWGLPSGLKSPLKGREATCTCTCTLQMYTPVPIPSGSVWTHQDPPSNLCSPSPICMRVHTRLLPCEDGAAPSPSVSDLHSPLLPPAGSTPPSWSAPHSPSIWASHDSVCQ